MESESLIETLETAGLSPYQAAAYVALLDLGTASATEIAEVSEVPGPRIYDVLRSLADREYVETYEQDTLRARAHSPADVLEDLRGRADRFESAAEEIEERWEQPELESTKASIVKRFQTVLDRARMFIDGAESQIHLSVTPRNFERLSDSLERAVSRGVTVQLLLYTERGESLPDDLRYEGRCTETRHRGVPTQFVALVDRKRTCFSHHPDSFDRYGVLADDETHTFVFHWYFRTCLWEHAETVYSAQESTIPVEYVDVRQFLRDLRPVLESETTLTVTVAGTDTRTGDEREFTGTVESVTYEADTSHGEEALQSAGAVTIVVDTGGERISVGGWGAVIEDVEAARITIESAEPPLPSGGFTDLGY